MAILSITERPTRSTQFGLGYSRRRKRIFRVITDSDTENEDVVAYGVGVSLGDVYVSFGSTVTDPLCLCVDIDATPLDDNPTIWLVTCSYETSASAPLLQPTQNQQPGEGGDADDPTQWAPLKSWSYGTMQLPMRKAFDLDGDNMLTLAVVNSAGYPFKPPPPRNAKFSILTHTRYEATFDADFHRQYADAVNAGEWNGFAAECVCLADWQVEEVFIGTTLFYKHTRVFHFCPLGLDDWQLRLLDQGTRDAQGLDILDPRSGSPIATDWPLDGTGFALPSEDVLSGDHFTWILLPDHPTMPFDVFGITL